MGFINEVKAHATVQVAYHLKSVGSQTGYFHPFCVKRPILWPINDLIFSKILNKSQ